MSKKSAQPKKSKRLITQKKPDEWRNAGSFMLPLGIIILTLIVYASSLRNGWTNWDDEGYVLNNALLKSPDLKTLFSTYVMGNYHPLTVLVQSVEYYFFTDKAAGYHFISLLIHIANTVLLFYCILLLTKRSVAAFAGALLFAIHPLHVESVAWISAQKDLLYTGFYFAAMIFYLKFIYSDRKKIIFIGFTLIAFIFSNLCKAQAVTLPVVLLLIDYYLDKRISKQRFLEKLPFFVIAIVFGIVAVLAQKQSESIQDLEEHSFAVQLLFASYSFIAYIIHCILPLNLSAYYPYPEKTGGMYPFYIYSAPIILILVSYLLFHFRKKVPSVVFGMLFFLVNILLVLQLLPVGGAMMADRYSYLSAVGIFFPVAIFTDLLWERKLERLSRYRTPMLTASALWLFFLLYQAQQRSTVWYSSETLWSDVIRKYPRVPIAQNNLGSYYQKHAQPDLAKPYFDAALRLQPDFANALINRCDYFRTKNQIDSALIDGNHAVRLDPESPEAHQNRGIAFAIAGKLDSAKNDFRFVITHKSASAQILNNLGNLFMIQNLPDSAIQYYNAALKVDPAFLDVLNNRGKCYVYLGEYQLAINDLTQAIQISPQNGNNYYFRMQAYLKIGKTEEARLDAHKASSLGIQIPQEFMRELNR